MSRSKSFERETKDAIAQQPILVQACRPADREMLKTDAGKALIKALAKQFDVQPTTTLPPTSETGEVK